MGGYNKERFGHATFRRDLLRRIDDLKKPNESRNDVVERLLNDSKTTISNIDTGEVVNKVRRALSHFPSASLEDVISETLKVLKIG